MPYQVSWQSVARKSQRLCTFWAWTPMWLRACLRAWLWPRPVRRPCCARGASGGEPFHGRPLPGHTASCSENKHLPDTVGVGCSSSAYFRLKWAPRHSGLRVHEGQFGLSHATGPLLPLPAIRSPAPQSLNRTRLMRLTRWFCSHILACAQAYTSVAPADTLFWGLTRQLELRSTSCEIVPCARLLGDAARTAGFQQFRTGASQGDQVCRIPR